VKQVPDDTVSLDESLSPAEQAATAAEVFALSSAEQSEQAYATLLKLAALEFDSMDGISRGSGPGIRTLDQAMHAVESGLDGGEIDPIFGKMVPSFDGLKTVVAPKMRKAGGSYRANQVRLLGADTPAAVYDLVKQRRDECFSCLSPGYMASRLYFVKQWIWFCLEVAEVNPIRKWMGSCDDFEDGLIEAFVLTCSCRFVTWGSINQARMHVVEFLRWTTGVVPPELPKTMYTMQKLKKLMAVERPEGRKLRTGFTVSEITAMFDVAWAAVDKENDGVQKAQLANMTAALGFIYERGLRGGNVCPLRWNCTDHLSRQTIRGLVRSEDDFQRLEAMGGVAEIVNPPKQKTSTHVSEVARQTTTKPLIFDLKATACFSMRRLGVLLHEHDDVDGDDAANTPAFRDCSGECVTPGNLRLFLIQLAEKVGIDVVSRGIGLHSLRIARSGAWAAGMENAVSGGFFDSARKSAESQLINEELDRLTGHTSGAGTAPYRRDEITKSLAQDRAAAVAVMSPVEILFQFTGDRTQGQQITVRLDADGKYSTVEDEALLGNYEADTDEDDDASDSAEAESPDSTPTGAQASQNLPASGAGQGAGDADMHMNFSNQAGAANGPGNPS